MKKLASLIQSLFCPSVDKTLNTFQKKIDSLSKRVDFDVDEINAADAAIKALNTRKQALQLNITKAENAIEKLEEITG